MSKIVVRWGNEFLCLQFSFILRWWAIVFTFYVLHSPNWPKCCGIQVATWHYPNDWGNITHWHAIERNRNNKDISNASGDSGDKWIFRIESGSNKSVSHTIGSQENCINSPHQLIFMFRHRTTTEFLVETKWQHFLFIISPHELISWMSVNRVPINWIWLNIQTINSQLTEFYLQWTILYQLDSRKHFDTCSCVYNILERSTNQSNDRLDKFKIVCFGERAKSVWREARPIELRNVNKRIKWI